jgi:hypothetical protein
VPASPQGTPRRWALEKIGFPEIRCVAEMVPLVYHAISTVEEIDLWKKTVYICFWKRHTQFISSAVYCAKEKVHTQGTLLI